MKRLILVLTICFMTENSFGQQVSLRPDGINGSAGAGFAVFNVGSPSNLAITMDDGIFAGVAVEKGFGKMGLYLTFGLNYLTTKGEANYNYTTLAGTNYAANGVSFDANFMQAALGFKLKLLESYWFCPYIEGGGLGGYFGIKYKNLATALGVPPTSNFKADDSLLDFGSYYEGGIEIAFSNEFGVKIAARFTNNETKELETFADEKFKYMSQVYYLSALKAF